MSVDWLDEQLSALRQQVEGVAWPDPAALCAAGSRRRHRPRAVAVAVATAVVLVATTGIAGRSWGPLADRGGRSVAVSPASPASSDAGSARSLAGGHWSPTSVGPLAPRSLPSMVWTGSQVLIWGGENGALNKNPVYYGVGASFDPTTGAWAMLPPSPLSPRYGATAVWTGDELLVWGGAGPSTFSPVALHDGATYQPGVGWTMLPPPPVLDPDPTAWWTGSQVLLFGGVVPGVNLLGAAYSPSTNTWTPIPQFPAPYSEEAGPKQEAGMSAVWTGSALVGIATLDTVAPHGHGEVWGYQALTASWSPGAQAWTVLPSPPNDVATYESTATWTGHLVLVAGGVTCRQSPTRCGVPPYRYGGAATYDPVARTWHTLPSYADALSSPMAWTGQVLLIAGAAPARAKVPAATAWAPSTRPPARSPASPRFRSARRTTSPSWGATAWSGPDGRSSSSVNRSRASPSASCSHPRRSWLHRGSRSPSR